MKIQIGAHVIKLTPANEGTIVATITDNGTTNTIDLPHDGHAGAGEIIETTINITATTTAINVTFPSAPTEADVNIIQNGDGRITIDDQPVSE